MSEKYTNTRTCREDEVPEWAKNGGQRQSEEYALLWGPKRACSEDEVPSWVKEKAKTNKQSDVTDRIEQELQVEI